MKKLKIKGRVGIRVWRRNNKRKKKKRNVWMKKIKRKMKNKIKNKKSKLRNVTIIFSQYFRNKL